MELELGIAEVSGFASSFHRLLLRCNRNSGVERSHRLVRGRSSTGEYPSRKASQGGESRVEGRGILFRWVSRFRIVLKKPDLTSGQTENTQGLTVPGFNAQVAHRIHIAPEGEKKRGKVVAPRAASLGRANAAREEE